MDVSEWVSRQQKLLHIEWEEEQLQRQDKYDEASFRVFQRLQARGEALLSLHAESPATMGEASSLEGHSLLVLSRSGHQYLPSHRFTSGNHLPHRAHDTQSIDHSRSQETMSASSNLPVAGGHQRKPRAHKVISVVLSTKSSEIKLRSQWKKFRMPVILDFPFIPRMRCFF